MIHAKVFKNNKVAAHSHKITNYKGFTLIETLVVVGIILILFGMGYANYREFDLRRELLSARRIVEDDIKLAQSYASAGRKDCTLPAHRLVGYEFSVDSSTTYTINIICDNSGTTYEQQVKSVTLPDNFTIASSDPDVVFQAIGQGTDLTIGSSINIRVIQNGTGDIETITVNSEGIVD